MMRTESSKARASILVTEGISTDSNPVQPLKAYFPIEVTEGGISTDLNPVHQKKA